MLVRIQKLLADAGYGSRRAVESWIRAGRIRVNGEVATLGQRISHQDHVQLDKKRLKLTAGAVEGGRIIALYKPVGVICTRKDSMSRPTVFTYLPSLARQRWISIGRLDVNSRGLLLFTNNGDWAHRFMHPSYRIEREYAVRVLGEVDAQALKKMRDGVLLDGRQARFTDIVVANKDHGANRWFYVVLMEGRNREVRRIWASQGLQVNRLIRVRYGSYILPRGKKPGACWELGASEVDNLVAIIHSRR